MENVSLLKPPHWSKSVSEGRKKGNGQEKQRRMVNLGIEIDVGLKIGLIDL